MSKQSADISTFSRADLLEWSKTGELKSRVLSDEKMVATETYASGLVVVLHRIGKLSRLFQVISMARPTIPIVHTIASNLAVNPAGISLVTPA